MSRKYCTILDCLSILFVLLSVQIVKNKQNVDYVFQDRQIERLHALTQYVDQLISKVSGEPQLKLLNGICPEKLLEETKNGLGFICKASDNNNCYCFSHTSENWYYANAFCRRFGMTLAENFDTEKDPSFFLTLNRTLPYFYWTSGSNSFIHNAPAYMNTGKPIEKKWSTWSSNNTCLAVSITKASAKQIQTNLRPTACSNPNEFVCHRFLKFFPI